MLKGFINLESRKRMMTDKKNTEAAPRKNIKANRAKYTQPIMRKFLCAKCGYLFFGFEDETKKCINCGNDLQ